MPRSYVRTAPKKNPIVWFLKSSSLPDACWPWTANKESHGYGQMWDGEKNVSVHRWIYEFCYGPIPEGLQIDHVCHTRDLACKGGSACPHRACCNPLHMELVTVSENVIRSWRDRPERGVDKSGLKLGRWKNALKTECKNGHPFDALNTYLYRGMRQCRECRKNYGRERREAKRLVKNITV